MGRESDNLARLKANERLKQKLEGTWGTTPEVNPTYAPCMRAPVPTCAVICEHTNVSKVKQWNNINARRKAVQEEVTPAFLLKTGISREKGLVNFLTYS